ncbi:MAG TPA: PP2C family protein-serine/threonine phosphatase [Spirochaetota bacterium]|nr:PP2C family protein-serine/threonine phosphatase [Spirochaetota bacterium]
MLTIIFMATAPVILLLKTVRHSMNRIRNTVLYYMIGFLVFFITFIITYFSGYYLYGLTLMNNPFISIPVIYMLILTNYLLLNLRNNDFPKFYRETLMIVLILAVYAIPSYFFLKYSGLIKIQPVIALFIKSTALFIWLVACYRLLNPLRIYFINRKRNRLIDQVNDILVPVHELRKITDMEKFWSFITKDNFQGLHKGFGIQSAYFMLINRKDRGYHFTYGFGPGIEPDFLSRDSIIVQRLSSYTGIFEKSYILTDTELEGVENEIDEFFTKNRLEAVIPFRNMSDQVIGFLFLGAIEGRKGFNTDILAALEIFRIKLQNFLTTGLILDEVTADQVNDHDRIVVDTIKKRILPVEMVSMPGIRMSSLHINNSSMGGDYLDSVKIGKESSILFMADTSYSGIDSALISLQLYSILHSRTMVFNSAEKVLNTMNQVLKTSRISGNQVKAACAIVSSDGDYTYSGASFNPLIIYDSETGKRTEVETAGIPLGIEMNYRYTLTTAKLREGSIGVLYSDGVITACNDAGEAFSVERITGIVSKFAKQNPSIIIREIYRDFSHFTGKRQQMNDFSLIVFKKVKTADE